MELDKYEDSLISEFRSHPVFVSLGSFRNEEFEEILLQRRFLSTKVFTPFCDLAIDGLNDINAKRLVGWLIREEYPLNGPSHRENLFSDLTKIGLSKEKILKSKETSKTKRVIEKLFGLVSKYSKNNDIRLLAILRLAPELLVSEEYKFFVPELEKRFGLKFQDSVFYAPHLEHDQKMQPLSINNKSGNGSHSDKLGFELCRLIDNEEKFFVAKKAMKETFKAKYGFYNQFLLSTI